MTEKKTGGIGKGTPGPGRPKGVPNRSTASVKAALEEAFEKMGGVASLVKWAKTEPTEFYKLYARMLPSDVNVSGTPTLVIRNLTGEKAYDA